MLGYNKNMAPLIQHTTSNQSFGLKTPIPWTEREDNVLIRLHRIHGPNWELISRHLNSSNESNDFYLDRSPTEIQRRYDRLLRNCNMFSDGESSLSRPLLNCPPTLNYKARCRLTSSLQNTYNSQHQNIVPCGLKSLNSANGTTFKLRLPDSLGLQTSSIKQRKLDSENCDPIRPTIISCLPVTFPSSSPSFRTPKDMAINPKLTAKTKLFTTDTHLSCPTLQQQTRSPQLNNQIRSHRCSSPSTSIANVLQPSDSSFLVQTPTKALSEADQFSFHLASPPAVLGNLVTGTANARTTKSTKLESNKTTPVRKVFSQETKNLTARPTLCTRLFDSPRRMASNTCTTKSIPNLSLSASGPGYTRSLSSSTSLRLTEPTDSKCLALLTAKATVWNRAFSSIPTSDRSQQLNSRPLNSSNNSADPLLSNQRYSVPDLFYYERANNNESMISNSILRPRESLKPLVPLSVPSRQQPHLALRRVLQIGHEDNWRELALGNNRARLSVVRSARLFLDEYDAMDRDVESNKEYSDYHQQNSNQSPIPNQKKEFIKLEPS